VPRGFERFVPGEDGRFVSDAVVAPHVLPGFDRQVHDDHDRILYGVGVAIHVLVEIRWYVGDGGARFDQSSRLISGNMFKFGADRYYSSDQLRIADDVASDLRCSQFCWPQQPRQSMMLSRMLLI
jgi:hypothetical protein